jgi:RNA polymerase sigma-70 factor (ECF subfamily)
MSSTTIEALADLDDAALASMIDKNFDAFTELYRRHVCTVFRSVRRQVRDDAAAEDITAQTFFRAWSSAPTYRAEGSYEGWLLRIAQNSIATWHSKEGRNLLTEDPPEGEDPTPGPSAQVISAEERDELHRVVSELPAAQRRAVVLRYLKEVPIDEIARLMGRTQGAVRVLLHRGIARLRRLVERDRKERT